MNIHNPPLPKLALIAGPTASGKSALALALAARTGGIIVNADSAQVYRDLGIVTARPSAGDEAAAPHRLYGYRDGAFACSAADWATDARAAIGDAHAAGSLPILVGGSGLYIRALLQGIAPVPAIDPAIRADVRAMPVQDAHAALTREDPEGAHCVRASDTARTARALEVVRATGRTLAEWQEHKVGGIEAEVDLVPLILLPPRAWLYQRCDIRFGEIVSAGGIEEVRALLSRRLDPALPVMRAIGVPAIRSLIEGRLDRVQALAAGQAATRQYAKRQYTWFAHQPPAEWPRFTGALDCDGLANALAELNARLSR